MGTKLWRREYFDGGENLADKEIRHELAKEETDRWGTEGREY